MTKPNLTPDPKNANKGTPRGRALLEDSLRRYGAGRSILVDKHGTVIAGNKTLEAAVDIGLNDPLVVPSDGRRLVVVQRMDLDLDADVAAKELALADNRIAQVSLDWDVDALNTLAAEGVDLTKLWTDEELATLLRQPKTGLTDPDAVPEVRATDIQPGDLFELGDHRLLCGDSTKAEDVARVMAGQKAAITWTSPPYNAGVSAKLRGNTSVGNSFYTHDKDRKSQDGYFDFLVLVISNALTVSHYAFLNIQLLAGNKSALCRFIAWAEPLLCDVAIWDKGHAAPQQAQRVLDSVFEFVWVLGGNGSRAIGTKDWRGQVPNIWRFSPQRHNDYADCHAATMPVEMAKFVPQTFTNDKEIVLEPFTGTGTTVIACEQIGRRCYAIEIEPQYVQVAIDRWEAFTGRTAVKVGSR